MILSEKAWLDILYPFVKLVTGTYSMCPNALTDNYQVGGRIVFLHYWQNLFSFVGVTSFARLKQDMALFKTQPWTSVEAELK